MVHWYTIRRIMKHSELSTKSQKFYQLYFAFNTLDQFINALPRNISLIRRAAEQLREEQKKRQISSTVTTSVVPKGYTPYVVYSQKISR